MEFIVDLPNHCTVIMQNSWQKNISITKIILKNLKTNGILHKLFFIELNLSKIFNYIGSY